MTSRKSVGTAVLALLFCVVIATAPIYAAAMDFYLKIEGIKGESEKGIAASNFTYNGPREASSGMATGRQPIKAGPTAPRDASSGMASGKRMHESITIMKRIDKASPLFMQAQSTGRVFPSVDLEFVRMNAGKEEVYKSVHLTNAMILTVRKAGGGGEMEQIEFTFQKIEWLVAGGKTAMDDWNAK